MKYMVVYDSRTGNTEKVAMQIFQALPGKSKDIRKVEVADPLSAEFYFVGFWNYKGNGRIEVMDFLSELHGKKVALFGTCGGDNQSGYYEQILSRVSAFVPEDTKYLGGFLCRGRMQAPILNYYRSLQEPDTPQMKKMIRMYEHAMIHPDHQDLCDAQCFVQRVLQTKEGKNGN